jgi:hypothetical protein
VDNQELGTQVATLQAERQRLIEANSATANQLRQAQADNARLQQEKEIQRAEFQRLIEQRAAVCLSPATGGQGEQLVELPAAPATQTNVKAGLSRLMGYSANSRWLIGLSLASLLLVGLVFLGIQPTNRPSPSKRTRAVKRRRPQARRLPQTH